MKCVVSPSTAFRFSGKLGKKDTTITAGSLNAVLQPREVAELVRSSSSDTGTPQLSRGLVVLGWSVQLLCSSALGGAAWLQGRTWPGGFSWEVSAGRHLASHSCHHCNNYHANH